MSKFLTIHVNHYFEKWFLLLILQLLRTFANLGPPKADNEEDCSVMHGLTMAVQCVGEAAPLPKQPRERDGDEDNKARIVCLTTLKKYASFKFVHVFKLCLLFCFVSCFVCATVHFGHVL